MEKQVLWMNLWLSDAVCLQVSCYSKEDVCVIAH